MGPDGAHLRSCGRDEMPAIGLMGTGANLQWRLGMGVGVSLILVAWLLPNHNPPWPAFYNEVTMAVAMLPLGAWLLLRSPALVRIPRSALVVALFSLVPLIQAASGQVRFVGDATLASLYLVGLAVCIVIGARLHDVTSGEAPSLIFLTFALGALASTNLALAQWLRLDGLGVMLADMPIGFRPYANIAQPNHLASLLFLGLVAIWGLYLSGEIRGVLAWLACAYLLFGMALTQSRTGWLEVSLMAAAAVAWHRRLATRSYMSGLISLCALYVILVGFLPSLNQMLMLSGGRNIVEQVQVGTRAGHWQVIFDAILAAPWVGYGWTQVGLAQQDIAVAHLPTHEVLPYAHNIFADLLVWNGIPLGLFACAAVGGWFWLRFRGVSGRDESLLLLALLGLMMHANLEYPHAYTYFIFPAGVIAGLICSRAHCRHVAKPIAYWVGLALVPIPFALTYEYKLAETAWYEVRAETLGIQYGSQTSPQKIHLLNQLKGLVEQTRKDPKVAMTIDEQAAFRDTVRRFPNGPGLYRLAQMEAYQDRPAEAMKVLNILCSVHPKSTCADAKRLWMLQSADSQKMAEVRFTAGAVDALSQ